MPDTYFCSFVTHIFTLNTERVLMFFAIVFRGVVRGDSGGAFVFVAVMVISFYPHYQVDFIYYVKSETLVVFGLNQL